MGTNVSEAIFKFHKVCEDRGAGYNIKPSYGDGICAIQIDIHKSVLVDDYGEKKFKTFEVSRLFSKWECDKLNLQDYLLTGVNFMIDELEKQIDKGNEWSSLTLEDIRGEKQ